MNLSYHSIQPENLKPQGYSEYDVIDFKISAMDRKITGGSIRLLGDVVISPNSSEVNPINDDVAYDGFTGAHSFIETISTSFASVGQVESLRFYSKYVSAKAKATMAKEDLFNSYNVCECRVPDGRFASAMIRGTAPVNIASIGNQETIPVADTTPLDFALKMDFCLNNMIGDNMIPYNKTGDILISLTLIRSIEALYGLQYGGGVGGTVKYTLKNLRLVYTSVMDDGKYSKNYTARIRTDLKQTVQSSFANISTKAPIVADSFFMSFIRTSDEANPIANGLENQRLPDVKYVEFLWNDSFSQQYRYQLDNEQQIVSNYISAINKAGSLTNNARPNVLASNDSWGVGLAFGTFLDLSKVKLGVNISSGVSNTQPFNAYMFFMGIREF
jgi:hypothetical protein